MSLHDADREDTTIYKVVVNHEEQYSIWPADRENALGWNDAGKQGTKAECLAYIEEVWTDMRPLSLRKKMEEAERLRTEPLKEADAHDADDRRPSVVERLSAGEHPLTLGLRPEKSVATLKEALQRGYVHVLFTGTEGGTELGVRLDRERSDVDGADLEAQSGTLHLEGELTLDGVRVRCLADIDIGSLEGRGRLEPLTV